MTVGGLIIQIVQFGEPKGKDLSWSFVVDVVFPSIIGSYRRPIPRTLRDRQATHRSVTHRS